VNGRKRCSLITSLRKGDPYFPLQDRCITVALAQPFSRSLLFECWCRLRGSAGNVITTEIVQKIILIMQEIKWAKYSTEKRNLRFH
jgi:hypothetical protein